LVLGLSFALAVAPGHVWAHRDATNCAAADVGLALEARFTAGPNDNTTVDRPLNEGETIFYTALLSKSDPEDVQLCAFEGGSLKIITPDGIEHLVAAPLGPLPRVPCLGGTADDSPNLPAKGACRDGTELFTSSPSVPYMVDFNHMVGAPPSLTAVARYEQGLAHTRASDSQPVEANVTLPLEINVACDCGENLTAPCAITVTKPDGATASGFTSLQKAIDAAPNGLSAPRVGPGPQPAPPRGPSIIDVRGTCKGVPLVKSRKNLLIRGQETTACPPMSGALTATLRGDPNATPPSGSQGEVVKVLDSEGIVVQFLNIVDGGEHDGLEFKFTKNSAAHCNCVTRNDEGYELDGGSGHTVTDSLVFGNVSGIRLHAGHTGGMVLDNLVKENEVDGIVLLDSDTERNRVRQNTVKKNGGDCIKLNEADFNDVLANMLGGGTAMPANDCGGADIRIENDADSNTVNDNRDPDGALVPVDCSNDASNGNTGNNCQ
jgi:parallel beta-helix repeat protein